MSENDEVEVIELTQNEWDKICQKHLEKLGFTALELKDKHKDGRLSAQEFKVWMLMGSSTLFDATG